MSTSSSPQSLGSEKAVVYTTTPSEIHTLNKTVGRVTGLVITIMAGLTTIGTLASTIYSSSKNSEITPYFIGLTIFSFIATVTSGICTHRLCVMPFRRSPASSAHASDVQLEVRSPPTTFLSHHASTESLSS